MSGLARFALFALVAAVAIWFVSATEWVDTEVPVPPKGEAARDSLYVARKLLVRLGMEVRKQNSLGTMPPQDARLLLTSSNWSMFPERPAQLEAWVRRGGHLVLPAHIADHKDFGWLGITMAEPAKDEENNDRPNTAGRRAPGYDRCRTLTDTAQQLKVCIWPDWREIRVAPHARVTWRMDGPRGLEVVRIALGQGSITVVRPEQLFNNHWLLKDDQPLLFAMAMQAERGAHAWLVAEESRERLVPWVWREGWVAVVLLGLALAAGLWRSALRFGPLEQPAQAQRRSLAEQVLGTARFLCNHGPTALQEAQQRAVHETAVAHVPGYASADAAQRASLLAARTGLPQAALAAALHAAPMDKRKLPASLQLLETARRRLLSALPSNRG